MKIFTFGHPLKTVKASYLRLNEKSLFLAVTKINFLEHLLVFVFPGRYELSDVAKISQELYNTYGKIVKLSGLIGRPDLLFIFDADEAEKVYRAEGDTPFRPSMPCIVKYKTDVRKEFFGDLPGVIGV